MKNEFNWIDLSEYDLQIIMTKLPNQKKFLVAWGADQESAEKLQEIGFRARPSDPTVLFASREKLGGKFFPRMKQLFPKAKTVRLPPERVVVPDLAAWAKSKKAQEAGHVSTESMKKDLTELRVELSQDQLVGTNMRDEKVYRTPEGRVCVGQDGETKMMNFKSDKSLFLIAGDKSVLRAGRAASLNVLKAVEPYARDINNGQIFHFDDLKRVSEIIYDLDTTFDEATESLPDAGASILKQVEESLKLSVEKYAVKQSEYKSGEELDQVIDNLYERIPKTPVVYFNKSTLIMDTPPAQADLIKKLMVAKDVKTASFTASNAGYLEAIVPSSVKLLSRVAHDSVQPGVSDILNSTAVPHIQFASRMDSDTLDVSDKRDFIYINEPPAPMAKKSFDTVTYTRKDLYRSAYNLSAMKNDGAAVIAIQEPLQKDGQIDGEFKEFLEWLYPRYDVKGAVEVDGALYGRTGEINNVRLLYIEGRNLIPELDVEVPTAFTKVEDFAALRGMSDIWLTEEAKTTVDNIEEEERKSQKLSDLLAEDAKSESASSNKFQVSFVHTSNVKAGGAMVNRDIERSSRVAHARLVREIGNVDEYVAEKLQFTVDQLHNCFFGEQVASIAQMIHNIENDKGFLLGDAPGQGKGRQLAAVMRYRLLRGETVLFITENSDLFRDIMRDFDDIDSADLVRPYAIDNEKTVEMMDGTVLDTGSKGRNEALVDGMIDTSKSNVFFSTYGQLRGKRKLDTSTKSRRKYKIENSLQSKVVEHLYSEKGSLAVIADEIHNAAAVQGNTNDIMEKTLDMDKSPIMSTGTSSRHIKNLSFYHRLFEPVNDREEFKDMLKRGGAHVTTALVQMLAEAGMYMRREEDLSKAIYRNIKDVTPKHETKQYINSVSKVFSLMAKLTGESKKHIFDNDKEDILTNTLAKYGGRLKRNSALSMGSTHFSSRFNHLQSMLITAMNVPTVVKAIEDSVQNNKKPVITFSNTGQSFSRRYVEKMIEIAEAAKTGRKVNPMLAKNLPKEVNGEWVFPNLPTYRDVLYFAVEDVMRLKIDTNGGKKAVYVDLGDLCADNEGSRAIQETKKAIVSAIEAVPDMPYAPVDIVLNECHKLGLNTGEITGRTNNFVEQPSGGWTYSGIQKQSKNEIIDGFNNGLIDVALMNGAGATGFSLHAAPTVKDQRPREMITLENQADILVQIQMGQRINRKGSTSPPFYLSVDLNLPSSHLHIASHNAKLAEFSACVTGSADSDSRLSTNADIMNKVGAKVMMLYLEENPEIMSAMGFDKDGFVVEGKYQFDGFDNKFKDALIRLPYDQQYQVLDEVLVAYEAEVEYLNSIGQNRHSKTDFNFKAKTVKSEVIYGEENSFGSVWNQAVRVRQIEYKPKLNTTSEDVLESVRYGKEFLAEDMAKIHSYDSYEELIDGIHTYLDNNRQAQVEKLQGQDPSLLRKYDDKVNAIKLILPKISIGQIVGYKDPLDKTAHVSDTVITGINIKGKNPLDWSMNLQKPGMEISIFLRVRDVVDDHIKNERRGDNKDTAMVDFTGSDFSIRHPLAREFDNARSKYITKKRVVLTGNLPAAHGIAKELGAGSACSYRDENGVRVFGVMMPLNMDYNDVLYRAQPLKNSDSAQKYFAHRILTGRNGLLSEVTLTSSASGYKPTQDIQLSINTDSDTVKLSYPKNKNHGAAYKTSEFFKALGSNLVEGKKSYNVAVTNFEHLESLLKFIYTETNHKIFSEGLSANFQTKLDNGEIVVDTRDIVRAFDGTSFIEEQQNTMTP